MKMREVLKKKEKAPAGLALIHIESADPRFHKRSFVMNPQGKSSITVLHEYSQRALKGHSIIVGRGEGPSKRIAKMVAAKQALAVLIPEIRFNDDFMATIQPPDATEKNYDDQVCPSILL
ncbi:hypothetical protein COOONC_13069 [Cooperia oncophora]